MFSHWFLVTNEKNIWKYLPLGGGGAEATSLAIILISSTKFLRNWNTTSHENIWIPPNIPIPASVVMNSLWFIVVLRWPKNSMSAIKTCNQKNMYRLLGLVLVLLGIYFDVVVTYFEMNVNSITLTHQAQGPQLQYHTSSYSLEHCGAFNVIIAWFNWLALDIPQSLLYNI